MKREKNKYFQCYNCGNFFDYQNITKEHVPAQNLFNGYSVDYKKNRITVNACKPCNEKYSKIDQVLRDAIGILNETNKDQAELTRQSVKSILRPSDGKKRLVPVISGGFDVIFEYSHFVELHKKNFKALFLKRYGYSINENEFKIQVICEGDENNDDAMKIYYDMFHYTEDVPWSISGHEDIFLFRMKSINVNSKTEIVDTMNLSEAIGVAAVLVYHKVLCAVVVAYNFDKL